jgi:hypothetical protein
MKIWAAVLIAAETLSSATNERTEKHCIAVRVPVEASITPATLAAAREEAQWIVRSLGAEVAWVDRESKETLVIRILPEPITNDQPASALGLAMPNIGSGNHGAVFLGRIPERVKASGGQIGLATLLGCAMAHEIGHLLLQTTTHDSEGIMQRDFGKAAIEKAARRRLTFTAADKVRFVTRVTAGALQCRERNP